MAQVKTLCPLCRQETTGPTGSYLIWVCREPGGGDFYTFTCTTCGGPVVKRCAPIEINLMVGLGVSHRMYSLPDELSDPKRRDTAPLTIDDVLDLLLTLGEG